MFTDEFNSYFASSVSELREYLDFHWQQKITRAFFCRSYENVKKVRILKIVNPQVQIQPSVKRPLRLRQVVPTKDCWTMWTKSTSRVSEFWVIYH